VAGRLPARVKFASEAALEDALSAPSPGLLASMRSTPGDIVVLGAAGKMGPTLARMARRAIDELGRCDRVMAVSRFTSSKAEESLNTLGIETIRCDLLDRSAVAALPNAPNVIFMAGQKFGTRDAPSSTWAMNVVLPSIAAERYADSRIVAFSTGNVYALSPVQSGGSRESDAPSPIGEYAMSCLGRERIFEDAQHAAARAWPSCASTTPSTSAMECSSTSRRACIEASRSICAWGTSTSSGRATRTIGRFAASLTPARRRSW
jgi:Nucleoside-diphosphate-sugar epimerases